jgi:hypothetical protein
MVTMGISAKDFATRYPRLYHMAEVGSWEGIKRHGLLSTSALLDRWEVHGEARTRLEKRRRPECVTITHPEHGVAVIRDQKPLDDGGLKKSLQDGLTPADWYVTLNARVFFWVSEDRLAKLLSARAYRDRRQTVLTIDTAALLARHEPRVTLSPINSGCTKPNPQPRGRSTFLRMTDYPFAAWERKRGKRDTVVELAVDYAVADVAEVVLRVDERKGGTVRKVLWKSTL